jgi:hypothetical protein
MTERYYLTINLAYNTVDLPFIVPMGSCGFEHLTDKILNGGN